MLGLQITWYLLIGVLLAGYAILDGFDLGVGMLHLAIARNDRQRRILLNSIGPVWDGNEVWLLTAGGAIFAAFPSVYATVFSGFYLALMLVLAALILRAVSLEFRSKHESPRWHSGWDIAFAVGSTLPAILFGVAIGNVLRGVPLTHDGEFAGSFIGLLNPFSILVGLLSASMFLMQGSAWLTIKAEGDLRDRARKAGLGAWAAFVVLWIAATLASRAFIPRLWQNYDHRLMLWIAPVAFIFATAFFPFALRRSSGVGSFTSSSIAIAMLIAIMGQGLFPNLLPALGDPAGGLTILNASSSLLTLKVMVTIALIGMPFVVGYTIFIYRKFLSVVVIDEHSY
jgi:cytochrome d ubiquinol oxidase subunit II